MSENNTTTNSFTEFITSFRTDYIEICWNESEFVRNNGQYFYDVSDDFGDSIKNIEEEIKVLRSYDENYYLTQKEKCDAYVINYENNLDENERVFINSQLQYFRKLIKWIPENNELLKLKLHIINSIVNQIDGNLGSEGQTSYVHSKFYDIEEEKKLNSTKIEGLKKEIQDLKQFIQFKNKFVEEEKELMKKLKHSIQNI